MTKRNVLLAMLLAMFSLGIIALVQAPEETLSTGYAITNNYLGIDVPPGSEVIVTALTTDAYVYQVTFIWRNPANITQWTDVATVYDSGDDYDGKDVYMATSTHYPEDIGEWGVQALFQSPWGTTRQGIEDVIMIRSTSFNVIPEIAILGSAGAAIAMLLGLGFYKIRRK